jgi:hypothetical protein
VVNGLVPRGPGMGCHVAPQFFWFGYKIIWSPWGSNPGPPALVERLHTGGLPIAHALVLIIYVSFNLFEFDLCVVWRGGRVGA